MKKLIAFFLIATSTLACALTVIVEEPCLTCSDAILGATLTEVNACSGSLELWQTYKSQVCEPDSLCVVYCIKSLCNDKAPSPDCRSCARFGTVEVPQQDFNYATCNADK
jgi:hypothetical protein